MKYFLNPLIFVFIFFNQVSFAQKQVVKKFPFTNSGLTERQAAEHLLSKFTFGVPVSYTHLRAHETVLDIVCRLLLEKKTTVVSATRFHTAVYNYTYMILNNQL